MGEPRTSPARRLWHYVLALLLFIVLTWLAFTLLGHPRDEGRPAPLPADVPATASHP